MTEQEAMDRVKIHLKRIDECRAAGIMVESDVLKTLATMAQKQIPKKPITIQHPGAVQWKCSCCDVFVMCQQWYCVHCGQKLDWSEKSEDLSDDTKLTAEEFKEKYCNDCGSQRCTGPDTEWFEGCQFKKELLINETGEEKAHGGS